MCSMLLAKWHYAAPKKKEDMNVERYHGYQFHCILSEVKMEKCEIGGVKAVDGVG